jgi:hypothetical protein
MNDAIIGGAIAAVIGAVSGAITSLCQERRREKVQRLAIVDALIAEIEWNLKICKSPVGSEMWWFESYKLEAYHAYKGQLFFLHEDVRGRLGHAVRTLEGINIGARTHLSQVGFGKQVVEKPLRIPEGLIKDLESANEELRNWRTEHTRSLAFRIRRRLRNFFSKIHNNSKLNHS